VKWIYTDLELVQENFNCPNLFILTKVINSDEQIF
jgi:hypothetical protein